MSEENVVLFDSKTRGGMARRGAPDKSGSSTGGSAPPDAILLRCPSCGSDLRLKADWIEGHADVLCGRCETEIPLPPLREESVR